MSVIQQSSQITGLSCAVTIPKSMNRAEICFVDSFLQHIDDIPSDAISLEYFVIMLEQLKQRQPRVKSLENVISLITMLTSSESIPAFIANLSSSFLSSSLQFSLRAVACEIFGLLAVIETNRCGTRSSS